MDLRKSLADCDSIILSATILDICDDAKVTFRNTIAADILSRITVENVLILYLCGRWPIKLRPLLVGKIVSYMDNHVFNKAVVIIGLRQRPELISAILTHYANDPQVTSWAAKN